MFRFLNMGAMLGGFIGILVSSCLEPAEAPAKTWTQKSTARITADPSSAAPLLPDSLEGELVAVTVVDGRQLNYRLVSRERFYLLQKLAPDTRLFHHVRVDSARQLENLLDEFAAQGDAFPHISVASFPADLNDLPVPRKKEVFFHAVLPLVRFHNEVIAARRNRLEQFARTRFRNPDDRSFLEEMCRYYRLEDYDAPLGSLDDTLRVLLRRADQVPPSIALAQAAIESGWGGSRYSRRGNNLFGQRVWDGEAPGLALLEGEQPRFRLAVFPTIGASIRSYMRNLNTHPAYAEFRRLRQQLRQQGDPLDPLALVGTLQEYSTRRQEYVEELIGFIEFNGLRRYDMTAVDAADEPSL